MDDGYEEEIRLLLSQLQIVELPPKPLQPYKRFERDFQNECNARAALYRQEFADQLWNSLDLLLKEEYRQLFEREFQTYERLQSIQNKINEPIKKTNPYLLYYAEQSKELAALSHQERQNAITLGWQNLQKEEKRKYELKMQSQQLVPKEDLIQEFQTLLAEYNRNSQQMPKVEFMDKQEQIKEEIDMIIGIRRIKGKKEYLVRWKGKTGKDAAWVAKKQLRKAKEMVKFFEETYYKQNFDEECSSGFSSTPVQLEAKKNNKTTIHDLEDIVEEEEKSEQQPEKKQRKKVQIETVQKEQPKQLKTENTKNIKNLKNTKQQEKPQEKEIEIVKSSRSTRSKELPLENIKAPRSKTPTVKEQEQLGRKVVVEENKTQKQKREPVKQKQTQSKEVVKKQKETKSKEQTKKPKEIQKQPKNETRGSLRESKKQEELPSRRNSKKVEQQTDKNKKAIKKKEVMVQEKKLITQKNNKSQQLKSVNKSKSEIKIKTQNRAKTKSKIEIETKNKATFQIKTKIKTKIKEKRTTRNNSKVNTNVKQQAEKQIVSVSTRKQLKKKPIKKIPEIKKKIQKQTPKTAKTQTRSQKMRK